MSTDTTPELEIPDEAADAGAEALRGYEIADSDLIDAASAVLQAAGPALVAAAYRRIAEELTAIRKTGPAGIGQGIETLLRRADQLDSR